MNSPSFALTSLFSQVIANPTNTHLWTRLAELAPQQSRGIFRKYLFYLQTGTIARQRYGTTKSSFDDKQLRVTFFTPSPCKRLLRHTMCAKAAGMKIQLIVQDAPWQSHPIHENLYDDILHVNNIFFEIDQVMHAIRSFNSSLIHMITCASTNEYLLPLALTSPLPVVGDPYDLCHGQFLDWPGHLTLFFQNKNFEKTWMQHVDALCMRALYFKMPTVRAIVSPAIPVLHMPDAVRSTYCVRNTNNINSNKLNIAMDGTSTSNEILALEIQQILNMACIAENITIHIYRAEDIDYSKYGSMVKTYKKLPVYEFENFLKSMDAFMMPSFIEFNKWSCYTPEMPLYSSRSTISDNIESDLVSIIPSNFVLNARIATKANRGIIFTPEEQTSLQFWKTLPQRVAALRQQEPTPQKFLDTTLGPHLDSFYRRVIRRTASRH